MKCEFEIFVRICDFTFTVWSMCGDASVAGDGRRRGVLLGLVFACRIHFRLEVHCWPI
jgi:hypothetical protein